MIFSKVMKDNDPAQTSFAIGFTNESEFLRWKKDMESCIRDAVQIMNLDDSDTIFREAYGKNIEDMKVCVDFICSRLQIVDQDGIKLIVLLPDGMLIRFLGSVIGCASFYHIVNAISDQMVDELMKSFSLLANNDDDSDVAAADDRCDDSDSFHVPEL